MVRTGRVQTPLEWEHCGYHELFYGRQRYQVVSVTETLALLGYHTIEEFREKYPLLIREILQDGNISREPLWTETKVIGTEFFRQNFS